jgi:hypothetical protein
LVCVNRSATVRRISVMASVAGVGVRFFGRARRMRRMGAGASGPGGEVFCLRGGE